MSKYDDWTDAELLEEADERALNTVECNMLDSMMGQSGYDKTTKRTVAALSHKQREWLLDVLKTTRKSED